MLSRMALKNPVLMIGILMMLIFLMTSGKSLFKGYKQKLTPTSCKALLVKLKSKVKRNIPENWEAECEQNNLAIEYELKIPEKFVQGIQNPMQQFIYRDLANSLTLIAKKSPVDNLEKTDIIRLRVKTDVMTVNAVTDGRNLSRLYYLKDPKIIAKHFKATVQIQEVLNKK